MEDFDEAQAIWKDNARPYMAAVDTISLKAAGDPALACRTLRDEEMRLTAMSTRSEAMRKRLVSEGKKPDIAADLAQRAADMKSDLVSVEDAVCSGAVAKAAARNPKAARVQFLFAELAVAMESYVAARDSGGGSKACARVAEATAVSSDLQAALVDFNGDSPGGAPKAADTDRLLPGYGAVHDQLLSAQTQCPAPVTP